MPRVVRLTCGVVFLLALAIPAGAQQTTTTTKTKSFEVISVTGSDLVVKLPEGTRELTVPEDFRFTVDGQQLSVHDLKAGMKGTATITTKTTMHPVTVTEVKNGTVMNVTGSSMIVRTDQGIKSFTQGDIDKRGVKIVRDGRPAEIADFRAGDQLTATIVTSKPPKIVTEQQVNATLARSGAAGAAATGSAAKSTGSAAGGANASLSAAAGAGGATMASGARKLPKTASATPLVGLVGAVAVVLGLTLAIRRRSLIG